MVKIKVKGSLLKDEVSNEKPIRDAGVSTQEHMIIIRIGAGLGNKPLGMNANSSPIMSERPFMKVTFQSSYLGLPMRRSQERQFYLFKIYWD